MRHREDQTLHVTAVEVLILLLNANFIMHNVAAAKRLDMLQKFIDQNWCPAVPSQHTTYKILKFQ